MALELLKKTNTQKGLFAIEKIGLIYTLITTCIIAYLYSRMEHPWELLFGRTAIVVVTGLLYLLYQTYSCKLTSFLRTAFQLGLLAYWYPDTYEFNRYFPNLDHLFASWEQTLFHCQPAITVASDFSSAWYSEAFNLGYFSYYPMIFCVVIFYFLFRYKDFEKTAFILVASFFIYYLIYIFVPVAGPQYYFPAIGAEEVAAAHFPPVGDYFNYHTALQPSPGQEWGFFYRLVDASQEAGERPTAAFPSSHVGISTILLILAYKAKKTLFLVLLPFYVLLCCATVYIQAHYLIDAIAGFITAFIIYGISVWMYTRWFVPVGKLERPSY